jgi:hypothetical protein
MSPTERLVALMDHLGLGAAHFGTPIPRDISGMAAQHPERLAASYCACRAAWIRRLLSASPIAF